MRLITIIIALLSLFTSHAQVLQKLTARDILNRSIAFHDPQQQWSRLQQVFYISSFSSHKTQETTQVVIDNPQGFVSVLRFREGKKLEYAVKDTLTIGRLNDSYNISPDDYNKFRLNPQYIRTLRNYYLYLYGLPMKLTDKGVILSDSVAMQVFNQQDCYVLTVNYDARVGTDTWYFYINKANFALEGYRFRHNRQEEDGEYIILEGHQMVQGIRMPKVQKWFYNKNKAFISTEILDKVENYRR